jgi:hypothetical protein
MPDSAITTHPTTALFRGKGTQAQQTNSVKFATGGAPTLKRGDLAKGTVYGTRDQYTGSRRSAPYSRSDEDRAEELRKWATSDINAWEPRQRRFRRDQDLFQATKPDTGARNPMDAIVLPDPKILVKKVARLIARHPNVIEVPAKPGVEDTSIAQRIENYLYLCDQSINQRWMMGLNNPYRYDQAQSLLLRGWLAERTLLVPSGEKYMDDDPSALWDHQVIDPALVYPKVAGNKIVRVTHAYETTIGEVKYDPILYGKEAPKSWDDMEDTTLIRCTALYWCDQDGTWWHAVLATPFATSHGRDSEFLKKPTEIGYNPWTILTANGITHRNTPWETGDLYVENIGTGILDESADLFIYLNRAATKINELLSLEANPPAAIYVENGQIKTIDLGPGARNYFTNADRDKIELLRTGPRGDTHELLMRILEKRLERAGLPAAFYSEGSGESPFSAAVLMAAGKDVLFPFVEAINQADALRYRKFLEIYRDYGPSKKLQSYTEDGESADRLLSADISAKEIKKQGTFVKITREDMTPQEYGARINLGLAQLARDAISMETFRRDYAKIRNPRAENRKIISEKVYTSEDVIKALIPIALQAEGLPDLRKLWEMTQNPVPPEGAMPQPGQIGPGGPPGMPPGQPPMMPPGNPMGNMPGLPAVPPNMGMPPQLNNGLDLMTLLSQNPGMLAALTGGALGGGGMGGTPPIPGTTGQVPPIPPFFRPQ